MWPFDNAANNLQAVDDIQNQSYKPIGTPATDESFQQKVAKQAIGQIVNPNPPSPQQPSHHSVWGMSDDMFNSRDSKTGIRTFNDAGNAHLENLAKNNVGLISSLAHMSSSNAPDMSGGQVQAPPSLDPKKAMGAYEAYSSGADLGSMLGALI